MTNKKNYRVTILAYPGMTLLDAVGPNEVLANSPNFEVTWASTSQNPVENDHRSFGMHDLVYFENIASTDIILVPGGPGDHAVMQNESVLAWLRKMDQNTLLTTSVCTGSLVLAKAGVLTGEKASSHWGCLKELAELGAIPKRQRFTVSGKYVTSSGVSAGIDMAFYLLASLVSKKHASEIRFGIEYFPNQFHLISSYTLPRFMLDKLTRRFEKLYQKIRLSFID